VINSDARFLCFRTTLGEWNNNTLYKFNIEPLLKEIIYYEKDGEVYADPSVLDLPPELRVWWQLYNETQSYNWTYQDINWEFGPRAHYELFCYNTSASLWYEVTPDSWVILNSPVRINATIPKLLFDEDTELGKFEINWNMWTSNISAFLSIYYDEIYEDQWRTNSFINNYTKHEGFEEPKQDTTAEFYTLDLNETDIVETQDYYNIIITGQFNEFALKGIYHVDMMIYDNQSNNIRGPANYWNNEMSTYKRTALGGPWSEVEAFFDDINDGSYIGSILNADHDIVSSVGTNETFIIQVNVTGIAESDLANVSVIFPLPWGMKTYVNVTGWHEEYELIKGGWIYNKTLKNYVWDANATIVTKELKYGPYMEETWLDWSRYQKQINVTRFEYNGSNYAQYIQTEHIMPRLQVFYDNLQEKFETRFIYEHYNSTLMKDNEGREWINSKRVLETKETPTEMSFYQLLNATKKVEQNKIIIEFKGRFIKKLSSDIWLDYQVSSIEREIWPHWEWMHENGRFLSIEKPIVNIRIFDKGDNNYRFNDYIVEPNDWFIIEAKIEGDSELSSDVDGIKIVFRHHDYQWTQNETKWSNLETVVTVDFLENICTVVVYNETSKSVFEYGAYEEWNVTTGQIEEVEKWRWVYYVFNQTGEEWVKGGIPWRSNSLISNETNLLVNDFINKVADDGRYIIQVNMSFTEEADNRWYNYDIIFLNWTYGPDHSKPWGEYLSEDWVY
jgi:hypothetical protein